MYRRFSWAERRRLPGGPDESLSLTRTRQLPPTHATLSSLPRAFARHICARHRARFPAAGASALCPRLILWRLPMALAPVARRSSAARYGETAVSTVGCSSAAGTCNAA